MTRPDGSEAAESWALAWLEIDSALLAGIHHALNNRLASLSAILQIVGNEIPPGHPLAGAIEEEPRRWEELAERLSYLLRDEEPEALLLREVLDQAEALIEIQHELRDLKLRIEIAGDLPPLWIERSALLRIVLLMLEVVGPLAREADGAIQIEACAEERGVRWSVRAAQERSGGAGVEPGHAGKRLAIEQLLARRGGELRSPREEGGVLEAYLPGLHEVRTT